MYQKKSGLTKLKRRRRRKVTSALPPHECPRGERVPQEEWNWNCGAVSHQTWTESGQICRRRRPHREIAPSHSADGPPTSDESREPEPGCPPASRTSTTARHTHTECGRAPHGTCRAPPCQTATGASWKPSPAGP